MTTQAHLDALKARLAKTDAALVRVELLIAARILEQAPDPLGFARYPFGFTVGGRSF